MSMHHIILDTRHETIHVCASTYIINSVFKKEKRKKKKRTNWQNCENPIKREFSRWWKLGLDSTPIGHYRVPSRKWNHVILTVEWSGVGWCEWDSNYWRVLSEIVEYYFTILFSLPLINKPLCFISLGSIYVSKMASVNMVLSPSPCLGFWPFDHLSFSNGRIMEESGPSISRSGFL